MDVCVYVAHINKYKSAVHIRRTGNVNDASSSIGWLDGKSLKSGLIERSVGWLVGWSIILQQSIINKRNAFVRWVSGVRVASFFLLNICLRKSWEPGSCRQPPASLLHVALAPRSTKVYQGQRGRESVGQWVIHHRRTGVKVKKIY